MSTVVKRGIVAKYNQDSLDVWLLRDGLNIVYDSKVKEVSEILHNLGWRSETKNCESLAFEDKINMFLHKAQKYLGLSGNYSFDGLDDASKEMREELEGLVEDMDAVITDLGYEITFGNGSYVIEDGK